MLRSTLVSFAAGDFVLAVLVSYRRVDSCVSVGFKKASRAGEHQQCLCWLLSLTELIYLYV